MQREVKSRLLTAIQNLIVAQGEGGAKFAIADAYLAVDNAMSAALIDRGIKPTKTHTIKLERFLGTCSHILERAEVPQEGMITFLKKWHECRYSPNIPKASEAAYYCQWAYRIIHETIREIADRNRIDPWKLEEELYEEVRGKRWQSFEHECSWILEMWQQKLEYWAESGYGSKLGNKMINPAFYSNVVAYADDDITTEILATDKEISNQIVKFYKKFVEMIWAIYGKRLEQGADEMLDFTFSLKLSFKGRSGADIQKETEEMFTKAFEFLEKKLEEEKKKPK